LWPLSRKNAPKQFGKIIGDKTMLQLAVANFFLILPGKIFTSQLVKKYEDNVKSQLPELPNLNVLVEPENA